MRLSRFYIDQALQVGQKLPAPDSLLRHAVQVLRLQAKAPFIVFNGTGGEYRAHLEAISKRAATLVIDDFQDNACESPLALTLVQAMIKPDKMDFALQKAVELGVHAFQPLITRRSVVRPSQDKHAKKMQHWEAVAVSACEQCGRDQVIKVLAPTTLEAYLEQTANTTSPIRRLLLAPGADVRIPDLALQQPEALATHVLIGPEGGFHAEEVAQCLQAQASAVSLGSRILRAETAATAAITLVQSAWGDL